MKKRLILIALIAFLMIGCGKNDGKSVMKKVTSKVQELNSYNLSGTMEIINGEDTYTYDAEISFKKDNNYRVYLKNTLNNHVQIILKNNDGVYVLTPSLNKSFKFQSDWPYNNSQIYLWQTVINDINNDNDYKTETVQDGFVVESDVKYSNNDNLTKQKVYINNDYIINKVEVYDKNDTIQMSVVFDKVDLNPTFNDDYFSVNGSINTSNITDEYKPVSSIDDVIYPMYIPTNTHLVSQNKINTENGQRLIMSFDGDSPFMFIQETATKNDAMQTTPVSGEPIMVGETIGFVSNSSLTWFDNGYEYYITSASLNDSVISDIANSINSMAVGK